MTPPDHGWGMIKRVQAMMALLVAILMTGCSVAPSKIPPLKTVTHVDLPRFMGPWYVIGTIPWIVEKNNVGTMDIYGMRPDGKIDITYVFHRKELSAKREEMHAVGTVLDKKSNATWGVQFVWPFQAPYLVIDLAPDYSTTVIGHPSRDLIWIMARTPTLSENTYRDLLRRVSVQGYDTNRIVKVPQAGENR
jgi:apolipoprotein D and lipocalin family protein